MPVTYSEWLKSMDAGSLNMMTETARQKAYQGYLTKAALAVATPKTPTVPLESGSYNMMSNEAIQKVYKSYGVPVPEEYKEVGGGWKFTGFGIIKGIQDFKGFGIIKGMQDFAKNPFGIGDVASGIGKTMGDITTGIKIAGLVVVMIIIVVILVLVGKVIR
jgi:hypothetical protein